MTPIQRRACLSLRDVRLSQFGPHRFRKALIAQAESQTWASIELSAKQVRRLARIVRTFRRQIANPHLLFWAQRVLAEQRFLQEDVCPK
jgi:hypothetical protein